MLVNDNNREKLIERMWKHYNYKDTLANFTKYIEANPEKLEGYAEYLANECNDYDRKEFRGR